MGKTPFTKFLSAVFLLILILLTNHALAQPPNDNPCSATAITVGATCTFTQYTNLNATASPGVPAPGCASYSGGDVWFSAVVPASGSITFDSNTGGITDGGMAIYTGTCAALTLLSCNDDGSANGLMPSITETGLTPGSTIFIRVWEFGNDNNGTFSICAQAGPTCSGSTGNATCASANPFCTGVSYDYCNTTGIPSIGGSGIYDCLLTAPNPAFYFMNITTAGPINFNISQQTFGGVGIDVDFVLWGPFASQATMCSSISAANVVDCSYSTAAVETAVIPNALPGQWYMMLITNFSDQPGVINFSQTNGSTPGAGATNCNIVTATAGVCAGGLFTLTGSVTVPAPPASGTLTVTNSCGGSQVINAPFTSPINYSIPNLCGNGNNCTVSAVFSAGGAPVLLPTTFTAPSCNTLTAITGSCDGSGNYVLSGTLVTGCLPASGTLTITSSCGGNVVFNAPFTSPLAWSLPASNGTGGTCTITAVYSAAGAPVITPITITEPSCCGSTTGTITTTQTNGTQTTLANGTVQVVLCPGGSVNLTSNNNYTLPVPGCFLCVPGLMYAIYTGAGPTVPDPDLDPNWTGYYWTGEDFTTANSGGFNTNSAGGCSPLLSLPPVPGYASPSSPNNTLLFVPLTADATDLPNHDADADGCFDIGNSISITFLNPISFEPSPACNGSVSVNITGGYPEFFPALYTLTNTGAGTLSANTVTSGGNAVITGLNPGQTYSFSVNGGNGCNATFSGVYSGAPTVSITPAAATVCTATCVNLVGNVTSGVGPGNLTFTSNQCAVIPDAGIGAGNGNPTAVGGTWAQTSINVAGVCAPAWNTGEVISVCLNISHSFDGDLNIWLQAPNGTYYLLSQDNGGAGINYATTCFSATAATAITAGAAPFNGTFIPQGGAGTFAGLNGTAINGSWTLWVADDALGDIGTINNWSITFANENTYTYAWAPAAGLSATNILNPTACPAATTTYTLTVTNSCGCPQTATSTITVTSSITPTFNPVAAICSGATLAALPTTSTNGITGVWAPALNNTATTTYTFTPGIGQCATTTTLTITVNPNLTPTFVAVAAICSGDPLAPLPTTSTNGINGTWAPALDNTATTTYTFTPNAGQCATTTTLTITVNPLITPTFAAVAAICSGDPLAPLPTTSTNGINGTWAPALDNTATTTYTFTPNAGQCATTTTLTITVNPNHSNFCCSCCDMFR